MATSKPPPVKGRNAKTQSQRQTRSISRAIQSREAQERTNKDGKLANKRSQNREGGADGAKTRRTTMSLTQPGIESQAQDEQQIEQMEDSVGDRVAGEKRKRSVSTVPDGESLSPSGQPPAKQLKLDQSQANALVEETEEAPAGEGKQEILSTPEDVVEENKRKDVKMHFRSEPEPEPWFSQPLTWLTYNRNAAPIQNPNLGRVLTDEEAQARKLRDQTKESPKD